MEGGGLGELWSDEEGSSFGEHFQPRRERGANLPHLAVSSQTSRLPFSAGEPVRAPATVPSPALRGMCAESALDRRPPEGSEPGPRRATLRGLVAIHVAASSARHQHRQAPKLQLRLPSTHRPSAVQPRFCDPPPCMYRYSWRCCTAAITCRGRESTEESTAYRLIDS